MNGIISDYTVEEHHKRVLFTYFSLSNQKKNIFGQLIIIQLNFDTYILRGYLSAEIKRKQNNGTKIISNGQTLFTTRKISFYPILLLLVLSLLVYAFSITSSTSISIGCCRTPCTKCSAILLNARGKSRSAAAKYQAASSFSFRMIYGSRSMKLLYRACRQYHLYIYMYY